MSALSSLPSILLQSINRYIPSRDVVCVHTRVSHAFYSAASQAYSTKILPADDDHTHFLSSRSTDIWPWKYTGFEPGGEGLQKCNKKLEIITASKFLHQVRVWPRIPLIDSRNRRIDLPLLLKLRYLHTLHISDDSDEATVKKLFAIRPFPFTSLHSLSLPLTTPAIINAMPVLIELRRLALTDKITDVTPFDWKSFATKLPRLLFLDLPTNVKLNEEKNAGVIEFIRGCGETLKRLECAGVYQKDVLRLLFGGEDNIANTALEQVIDCGCAILSPAEEFVRSTLDLNAVRLTDEVLTELVKFPAMSRFTQPHTNLASIKLLEGIGERLKEFTFGSQPLFSTLAVEFRHVFPHLVVLETLSIGQLKSSQDFSPAAYSQYHVTPPSSQTQLQDEKSYCDLLLSIRSLPMLRKLVLDRIPLLRNHLEILFGVDRNGNELVGEQYFLTPSTPSGFVHLNELYLLSINSFVHTQGAMNPNPLLTPLQVGMIRTPESLEQARIGFERLCKENVLQKSCKVVMRGVTGLTQDGKMKLKTYFPQGVIVDQR